MSSPRFEPPSLKARSQVIQAMAAVQQHKPEHGEASGRMTCTRCRSGLLFTIDSSGRSRGKCVAAGCISWVQ